MDNKEIINSLNAAIEEITPLRGRLAILTPKARAFDGIMQILDLLPQQPQGYGVDIAWQLRKLIVELQPAVEVDTAGGEANGV